MSSGNVELMRRAFEGWRQDESCAEFLDPQIEWDFSAFVVPDIPVRGRGREDLLRLLNRYVRTRIDYEAAAEELIDAGDAVVMVLHEAIRGTEMLIQRDMHYVWTMQEGRAIRLRSYGTKQEALDAVGLSE
jgi:ketosteroid isomerase-like protein